MNKCNPDFETTVHLMRAIYYHWNGNSISHIHLSKALNRLFHLSSPEAIQRMALDLIGGWSPPIANSSDRVSAG